MLKPSILVAGVCWVPHCDQGEGEKQEEGSGDKIQLLGPSFQELTPSHLPSFHRPPLVHEITVLSVDRFADKVRALRIQARPPRSLPLLVAAPGTVPVGLCCDRTPDANNVSDKRAPIFSHSP